MIIHSNKFAYDSITVWKPSRKMVGVTELGYDWSLADMSDVAAIEMNETEASSIDDMLPILGVAVDPLVTVDGSSMHKASVIRQRFSGQRVSSDRLKRVRGMSKFESTKEVDLDKAVMLGVPAIASLHGTSQPFLK